MNIPSDKSKYLSTELKNKLEFKIRDFLNEHKDKHKTIGEFYLMVFGNRIEILHQVRDDSNLKDYFIERKYYQSVSINEKYSKCIGTLDFKTMKITKDEHNIAGPNTMNELEKHLHNEFNISDNQITESQKPEWKAVWIMPKGDNKIELLT